MPAFNEVDNVEQAVSAARTALESCTKEFEIIVVNDGSSDGTGPALDKLAKQETSLRVLHHQQNKGYGASLRNAFSAATHDLIFFTDCDLQFDIREIELLLPYISQFDLVTGYRARRKDHHVRKIASTGYNFIIRTLFGVRVRDVNCAFKLFRRELIEQLELESDDFFIDAELLCKSAAAGFTVREVGVSHYPRLRGQPTIRADNVMDTLREIFRIRKNIRPQKIK